MALLIYNILCRLYLFALKFAAAFNSKASLWYNGRENWVENLKMALEGGEKRIWIHCSSLGEFEQGRPIIESLKETYTEHKIVLTFFSPSGYTIRKNYDKADYIFYLPMDTKQNAKTFVHLVQPALAIFVKYEFWYHYLSQLHEKETPVLLVSAAFRANQPFFRWYGSFFRKMLHNISYFCVQDNNSKMLLANAGFQNHVLVSGDTRYDRVSKIALKRQPNTAFEGFKGNNKIIIAGSTWHEDEELLGEFYPYLPLGWKLIIAPHEIQKEHIRQIKSRFKDDSILYSDLANGKDKTDCKVLIIDNIGLLSGLYYYGDIAYVGGGFQKGGIHNILEPAVFGLPIIFGPIYEKFVEAKMMTEKSFAFSIKSSEELKNKLNQLISDVSYCHALQKEIQGFMQEQTGATEKIMGLIAEKKWLE